LLILEIKFINIKNLGINSENLYFYKFNALWEIVNELITNKNKQL